MKLALFILAYTINTGAMHNYTIVPLPGARKPQFSPDGAHVVACADDKITVYDAHAGSLKGELPNFPTEISQAACSPLEYQFSPQGTYFYALFTDKIWNLNDLSEHVPGLLAHRRIKLWNKHETVFLSAPESATSANLWHVHHALDGTILHSLDHTHEGIPHSPKFSSHGVLLACIYKMNHGQSKAVITNFNQKTNVGYAEHEIENAHQVEFCPDNEHALVAIGADHVSVYNCKYRLCMYQFICASQEAGLFFNFGAPNSFIQNSCSIKLQGHVSVITNQLNKKEKYIITQDEQTPHIFTCEKYKKPKTDSIIIKSLSGNLAIILKNKTRGAYGAPFYDMFLARNDNDRVQNTCLLTQVHKTPKNIWFTGTHDEQILLANYVENVLFIFDPSTGTQIDMIPFGAMRLHPRTGAFMAKPKEKDEQNEQWRLYILPRAAQILGTDKTSFFCVLPAELRLLLRRYNV